MREHMGLFRGKRIDNGEWVEGAYLHLNIGKDYICDGTAWIGTLQPCKYEVDPTTIGECTSLKDKNGKLIFEGDIVRDMWCYLAHKGYVEDGKEPESVLEEYLNTAERGVVKFCTEDVASCGCCYPPFVGSGFKAGEVNLTCCEIIGNIYDNPELLKGGEGA